MVTLRKGHCYSTVKRAYTRKSKYKKKGYVKGIPTVKIVRYDMGDLRKQNFAYRINLKTTQPVQIRQNALESCRQLINRYLMRTLGTNYYFKLHVYPHQVLRENRMITGAGADRMQTGMQLAFGSPVNVAARLQKNQTVFSVKVDEKDVDHAKEALKKATPRMPGTFTLSLEKI